MICVNCGATVIGNPKYCNICGQRMTNDIFRETVKKKDEINATKTLDTTNITNLPKATKPSQSVIKEKNNSLDNKSSLDVNVTEKWFLQYVKNELSLHENTFLMYIAISKGGDAYCRYRVGSKAEEIIGDKINYFNELYQDNYNDDIGIQLAKSLAAFYNSMAGELAELEKMEVPSIGDSAIDVEADIRIDKDSLMKMIRNFLKLTGIQFVVKIVDYNLRIKSEKEKWICDQCFEINNFGDVKCRKCGRKHIVVSEKTKKKVDDESKYWICGNCFEKNSVSIIKCAFCGCFRE